MAKNRKAKPSTTQSAPMTAPVATSASAAIERPIATKTRASHEQIARRAYELWLARGGMHGTHLEDWLAAERELHAA